MTIHILVEGPSERAFLEPWAKRLLKHAVVRVHPHQGKGTLPNDVDAPPDPRRRGLLDQLPAKLRAFAHGPQPDALVVLVDADNDDCTALADRLREVARRCAPQLAVIVRLAIEETEAFYLGDLNALARAFPNANMALAKTYVPDSICGTWEFFGEVVGDHGGNKMAWAAAMGPRLTTFEARTRSPSFRALIRALRRLDRAAKSASAPTRGKRAAKQRVARGRAVKKR